MGPPPNLSHPDEVLENDILYQNFPLQSHVFLDLVSTFLLKD